MKRLKILCLLLALALLLCACSENRPDAAESEVTSAETPAPACRYK